MNAEQLKTCSKCQRQLTFQFFYKKARGRNGLFAECKKCNTRRAMHYRAANLEKIKTHEAAWRKENPAKVRAYAAKRRKLYPDEGRAKAANWRKQNPERHNENARLSNANLPDGYVAACLLQSIPFLSRSSLPPQLIEAKRMQLTLHRLIKEKQQ